MPNEREVELRPISARDLQFLVRSGLDRERVGVQYGADEYRKQYRIAPMRFFNKLTRTQSFIIWVEGQRAGYVGLNPLSTNIEYYLQPWARGGTGGRALSAFLQRSLPFEVERSAFMIGSNERSQAVMRSALVGCGLVSGVDFEEYEIDGYRGFTVRSGVPNRT